MKTNFKTIVVFALIVSATMVWNNINAQSSNSIEELKASAAENDVNSQSILGFKYKNGTGVEKDLNKAFYWLLKAAEQNDFDAMQEVFQMYYFGLATEVDYKKSFFWCNKVDTGTNSIASLTLAAMYFYGKGIDKDYNKAFFHYHRAANNGNLIAMKGMVNSYKNGFGTPIDLEKVNYWNQQIAIIEKNNKEKDDRNNQKEKECNEDYIKLNALSDNINARQRDFNDYLNGEFAGWTRSIERLKNETANVLNDYSVSYSVKKEKKEYWEKSVEHYNNLVDGNKQNNDEIVALKENYNRLIKEYNLKCNWSYNKNSTHIYYYK